jgi:hypothetical protein
LYLLHLSLRSLSWARAIHSTSHNPTSLIYILGARAKQLQKETISVNMSVRLSACNSLTTNWPIFEKVHYLGL